MEQMAQPELIPHGRGAPAVNPNLKVPLLYKNKMIKKIVSQPEK